jgi:hypothetical protein
VGDATARGFIAGKRNFNTRCYVTIHRHKGQPIELVGRQTLRPLQGGPVALVAAQHSKSMSAAAGQFSITIKQGSLDIRREILTGDWVVIHWTRNGRPLHGMLGRIDTVRRVRRAAEGATAEDWVISGRDFGAIPEMTQIWFDEYTNYETNVGGQILGARMDFNVEGHPDQIVARIMDAWLGSGPARPGIVVGGTWAWPKSLGYLGDFFADGVNFKIGFAGAAPLNAVAGVSFLGNVLPNLRGIAVNEGALFNPNPGTFMQSLLMQYSNPVLNELFYDSLTDENGSKPEKPIPAVFMRERPFVNASEGMGSPWFKLPTWHLPFDAFGDDFSTGTNDAERLNLFQLYTSGTGMVNFDQFVAYAPSYDRESIKLHGLRKWEKQTLYSAVDNAGNLSWFEELAKWHTLVSSWYAPNHLWLAGSASVPFAMPEVRIGHRLIVGNEHHGAREQYYVEGVTTSWRYPNKPTTAFQLTRGYDGEDEGMVEMVREEYERYERRDEHGVSLEDVSTADTAPVAPQLLPDEGVRFT